MANLEIDFNSIFTSLALLLTVLNLASITAIPWWLVASFIFLPYVMTGVSLLFILIGLFSPPRKQYMI